MPNDDFSLDQGKPPTKAEREKAKQDMKAALKPAKTPHKARSQNTSKDTANEQKPVRTAENAPNAAFAYLNRQSELMDVRIELLKDLDQCRSAHYNYALGAMAGLVSAMRALSGDYGDVPMLSSDEVLRRPKRLPPTRPGSKVDQDRTMQQVTEDDLPF